MPAFKAGEPISGIGITPQHLVIEAPWGEIWRATHASHGKVFLAAYTTPKGAELFAEAQPGLARWNEVIGAPCTGLLRILERGDAPFPWLLVEDPEGKTLREHAASVGFSPKDHGKFAHTLAGIALQHELHANPPLHLTPDTIVEGRPGAE
ncbi:hypothetical protein HZA57_09185, partial [Candidatus Poribacteria bacterium]|nr:hypothetical protein [Candidatus Poribacteria bacterium]